MGRLPNLWLLLAVLLTGSAGAAGKDVRATDAAGPAQCAYAAYQGSSAGRPGWPAANWLGGAASPYLRLHEADPVHWRPWGRAALAEAAASGRLILLSIGYTACHWCHVMQRENFADAETARFMNSHFVNVLLDREELAELAGARVEQVSRSMKILDELDAVWTERVKGRNRYRCNGLIGWAGTTKEGIQVKARQIEEGVKQLVRKALTQPDMLN